MFSRIVSRRLTTSLRTARRAFTSKARVGKTPYMLWGTLVVGSTSVLAWWYSQSNTANAENKKSYHGIVLCGAPGSGKGTQAEFIKQQFGHVHLSTGDILRAEIKNNTALGAKAKVYMDKGALVPDELVINMVKGVMMSKEVQQKGWMLDGMPRTATQAEALDTMGCTPELVIYIDVPDGDLVERCCLRRSDPVTGEIYHLKFKPPPTPEIANRLVHRPDDNAEKVKARLGFFHSHNDNIINYYETKTSVPVIKIDGTKRPKEVYQQIEKVLSEGHN